MATLSPKFATTGSELNCGRHVDRAGPGSHLRADGGVWRGKYKQYSNGKAVMIVDVKKHRYGGAILWTMNQMGSHQPWCEFARGRKDVQICEVPWDLRRPPNSTASAWSNGSIGACCPSQLGTMREMALACSYTSEMFWCGCCLQTGSSGSLKLCLFR